MKKGLLVINLGTPKSTKVSAVRRYLWEFLTDRRVIMLPWMIRYILVSLCILPFRPKKSAKAYQEVWTKHGSPLLVHNQSLVNILRERLGTDCQVELGMRYGQPSITQAIDALAACDELIILPLYPQYASATTGSTMEAVYRILAPKMSQPTLTIIRDFYTHPAYIAAQAAQIKPYLQDHDFLLLSYHGIPLNHILQGDCKRLCQSGCESKSMNFSSCYRAQCIKTTESLAETLGLKRDQYVMAFQSRLGRTEWIKPYTDKILDDLAQQGIKRLAISCPSFVTDCLETLEEIAIRANQQWLALGGEKLTLIPALNEHEAWINAILEITHLTKNNDVQKPSY